MGASEHEVRVLVADELPVVRRGIAALFAQSPGMRVIADTDDPEQAPALITRKRPDVLVIDIAARGARGLDLIRALREKHAKLGIIVYGFHADDVLAGAVLKAGANGYVSKRADEEELLRAVRAAARGLRYLSPALAERLVREMEVPAESPPHTALSQREHDVLCFLAEGKRASEIAKLLGLSAKTIHTHRARILEKLGLRTTVDLVLYAVEHRLVPFAALESSSTRD